MCYTKLYVLSTAALQSNEKHLQQHLSHDVLHTSIVDFKSFASANHEPP
jgi:hypothetical protein